MRPARGPALVFAAMAFIAASMVLQSCRGSALWDELEEEESCLDLLLSFIAAGGVAIWGPARCLGWSARLVLSCAGMWGPARRSFRAARSWCKRAREAPASASMRWVVWLWCLAVPAASVAATMCTGIDVFFVSPRNPAALQSGIFISRRSHQDPVVAPALLLASASGLLMAAVGLGRYVLLGLVVFGGLESDLGDGIRIPEDGIVAGMYMTVGTLALLLAAVCAARVASSSTKEMAGRSRPRDSAFTFIICGDEVSLPLDARVRDLKTAILQVCFGDAEPTDGAAEDMAARSWFLCCNGKKVKDSKALSRLTPGDVFTLKPRPRQAAPGVVQVFLCKHIQSLSLSLSLSLSPSPSPSLHLPYALSLFGLQIIHYNFNWRVRFNALLQFCPTTLPTD